MVSPPRQLVEGLDEFRQRPLSIAQLEVAARGAKYGNCMAIDQIEGVLLPVGQIVGRLSVESLQIAKILRRGLMSDAFQPWTTESGSGRVMM